MLACHAPKATCPSGACCVNKRHLRWDTPQANMDDKRVDGTFHLGEDCHNAVLAEAQVVEIYVRSCEGERCADLAEEFSVSRGAVSGIKSGRSWAWLTSGLEAPPSAAGVRKYQVRDGDSRQLVQLLEKVW